MDIKLVERLSELSMEVEEIYEETGLISVDNGEVFLTVPELTSTFQQWEIREVDDTSRRFSSYFNGVEFFAMEYSYREKEEVKSDLPVLSSSNTKAELLAMLIDFYRLKSNPPEDLDELLLEMKREILG